MTVRSILSVAICVIVSLVLLAIATRYFHPHWILAAVHSLQLHFAAASAAALIVAILLHRSAIAWMLFAFSLILVAHAVFMGIERSSMASGQDDDAPGFRLMSFNMLSSNFGNSEEIARMIVASGADVVNVLEAEPLEFHLDILASAYPYRIGCGVILPHCSQVMLSKTPLRNGEIRSLSPIFENRFILADTDIAGQTIHLAGLHTTKPYFDNFQTMELIRAALAITDTDGPFVISGDFNASSLAPNIQMFLNRAELHTAQFEPPTWPTRLGIFGLPIDHVYLRSPLKFRSLKLLESPYGSNHAGLIADIAITSGP